MDNQQNENHITKFEWYCPLYQNKISEGKCLEINYERLGYFKSDTLEVAMKELNKNKEDIFNTCENCPNMPLEDS